MSCGPCDPAGRRHCKPTLIDRDHVIFFKAGPANRDHLNQTGLHQQPEGPLKAYIKQENTCKLQCSCQPCLSLPKDYFLEKAATCIARLQTLPGYSIWHLSVTAFTLEIAVSKPGYSSHFHVSRVTNDQCLLLSLLCWVCFFFFSNCWCKNCGGLCHHLVGAQPKCMSSKILSDTKKKECDKCFSSVDRGAL